MLIAVNEFVWNFDNPFTFEHHDKLHIAVQVFPSWSYLKTIWHIFLFQFLLTKCSIATFLTCCVWLKSQKSNFCILSDNKVDIFNCSWQDQLRGHPESCAKAASRTTPGVFVWPLPYDTGNGGTLCLLSHSQTANILRALVVVMNVCGMVVKGAVQGWGLLW